MSAEVSTRERLSFAAGDTGFNFVWQTIELYLLFYYVRILGLAPEKAAAIFLAGAAIDLIADPLIGALVDRFRARLPLRGWMLLAGPPLGLALALAFIPPPSLQSGGFAMIVAAHLLLRVCYSLGNVPYGALTARISGDPAEQMRLTSLRMQGAATGGLVAALVYFTFPLDRHVLGVPLGAVVLGLAAQPLFLATWLGVRERVSPSGTPSATIAGQLSGFIGLLHGSAVLGRLLALILLVGLSTTVLHKGLLFVFDHLGAQRWGYAAAVVPAIALFIGARMWTALAARRGRVETLRIAAALHLTAIIAAFFAEDILAVAAAMLTLAIFASAGMSTMFWALVPGVVEACERELATEGCAARVFGLANLARKLGQAFAPLLIALSLALPGGTVLPGMVIAACIAIAAAILLAPRPGELLSIRH